MCTYASNLLPALLFIVLTGAVAVANRAQAQSDSSILEHVRMLEVDSLHSGFWVYYTADYEDRAEAIGGQVAASNAFFRDSLGVDVDIRIALLDPADFQRAAFGNGYPYGLPFVDNAVAVLPADLNSGAVLEMYAPFESTASEKTVAALRAVGLTYAEASRMMVDLIGLHEIGHVQVSAFGIDAKQAWLGELLASYFGYAYMRSRETNMAVVWDEVMEAGRDGYEPTYSRLDDLNRLYAGVGIGDYVWYQNVFQDRIRSVYDAQGLDFLRRVKALLSDPTWQPDSAAELNEALEEIAPGFIAWAASYE
jgi:hypothetical protein